ncbi:hypothetical protein NOVOSPHI9U_230011 [Novosphingobium sp. 9U]|nr:hypothetical protein NOVOSPHI9U_230011 [Novosphingobium sp. 9U]
MSAPTCEKSGPSEPIEGCAANKSRGGAVISGFEGLPELVYSHLSHGITRDGREIEVQIYRLEDRSTWRLEVVDDQGTSTLWHTSFATELEALSAFRAKLALEGIGVFFEDFSERFPRRPRKGLH